MGAGLRKGDDGLGQERIDKAVGRARSKAKPEGGCLRGLRLADDAKKCRLRQVDSTRQQMQGNPAWFALCGVGYPNKPVPRRGECPGQSGFWVDAEEAALRRNRKVSQIAGTHLCAQKRDSVVHLRVACEARVMDVSHCFTVYQKSLTDGVNLTQSVPYTRSSCALPCRKSARLRRSREIAASNKSADPASQTSTSEGEWRRVPESNRSSRICNPLRNLSANPPRAALTYTTRAASARRRKGVVVENRRQGRPLRTTAGDRHRRRVPRRA